MDGNYDYDDKVDSMPPNEGEMEEAVEMTPEEEKFFKDFTDQEIDNKDPSLGDELIKIYEEEIPFEIRVEGNELMENSIFETLLCKILISDETSKQFKTRIEIACDKDLFFYYTYEIDSELFNKIKKEQKLTCNFNDFCDLLVKYFDFCMNDTKKYLAVIQIKKDGNAKMELYENLQYKFGELIQIQLLPASNDIIRKQIVYRYNAMRATQDMVQNRIDIINGVLKDNDPQLIPEIKNAVSKIKIDTTIRDKPLIQQQEKC